MAFLTEQEKKIFSKQWIEVVEVVKENAKKKGVNLKRMKLTRTDRTE